MEPVYHPPHPCNPTDSENMPSNRDNGGEGSGVGTNDQSTKPEEKHQQSWSEQMEDHAAEEESIEHFGPLSSTPVTSAYEGNHARRGGRGV